MKYFILSLIIAIISVFLLIPFASYAQDCSDTSFWSSGLVPCGRNCDNPATRDVDESQTCTLCHFIVGFWNVIHYGFKILVFVALTCLVIAGIMYIVSAGSEKMMETAKTFIKQILFGFAIVLLAWVFIFTVMNYFAVKQPDLGIDKPGGWTKFTCNTASTGAYQGRFEGNDNANKNKDNNKYSCISGVCQVDNNGIFNTKQECIDNCVGQKCGLSNDGLCKDGLTCPSGWWAITGNPSNPCPSGQTCCSKGYWPNPPESCSLGDGSCYYGSNFCPDGYHSIVGTCSKYNSVCCVKDPYWPNPPESCGLGAGSCYYNSNTCPSGYRSIIGVCKKAMSVCCQKQ